MRGHKIFIKPDLRSGFLFSAFDVSKSEITQAGHALTGLFKKLLVFLIQFLKIKNETTQMNWKKFSYIPVLNNSIQY